MTHWLPNGFLILVLVEGIEGFLLTGAQLNVQKLRAAGKRFDLHGASALLRVLIS